MTGTYIQTGASTYTEITGTKDIYAQTGTTTYTRVQEVYVQTGASTYVKVYEYDTTGPTVPIPTVSSGATSDTVSWTAVTDADSGVDTATLYQYFYNVNTNTRIAGNTYSIPTPTSSGSTSMAIATGRRNTPTGDQYQVHYYVVATDNAGNSTNGYTAGRSSTLKYTKPLGTFYVLTTGHGTWGQNGGWRSDLGALGSVFSGWFGATYSYQYGHWFYGSNVSTTAKGFAPDSGSILTYRSSTDGCTGGNVAFGTHNYASQPAGSPANDTTYWTTGTSQSVGNAREFTLTSATLGRIAVDSNFGMFMYPGNANGTVNATAATTCASGTTYRVFDSPFSDPTSGRLTLVYN